VPNPRHNLQPSAIIAIEPKPYSYAHQCAHNHSATKPPSTHKLRDRAIYYPSALDALLLTPVPRTAGVAIELKRRCPRPAIVTRNLDDISICFSNSSHNSLMPISIPAKLIPAPVIDADSKSDCANLQLNSDIGAVALKSVLLPASSGASRQYMG